MNSDTLQETARTLLQAIGVSAEPALEPLHGGANNRVFRVSAGGRRTVLKVYFQQEGDGRDRLQSEYRFVDFAWSHGVRRVPQPLGADRALHAALYEYVDGRPVARHEAGQVLVTQAIDFFHELNAHKASGQAAALPEGAEAYFTFDGHLQGIDRRVRRLAAIEGPGDVERLAAQFVRDELVPAWTQVQTQARTGAARAAIDVDREMPLRERCLSPSDFGFHNAILEPGDRVRFVDFEYAGWDDPAKLACDFFCQEAVPVDASCFEGFVEAIVSHLPDPPRERARCELLLPVYRIKWCCIMLNEFLPLGGDRRRFTRTADDEPTRKRRQLDKARAALARTVNA